MNRDNQDNRNDRRNERDQRPGRGPAQPMTPPPGFGPQRPEMGMPLSPPPFTQPGPGMVGPSVPPPNFIPQPPEMERTPRGGGPAEFGAPFGHERRMGQRDLRRCVNSFTFIWLINGNSFWFYPTFVDRQFVIGFRWRRNHWEFDRINVNRIIFFRCF